MDFAIIGTISSYVKQKNLTFAAKHKIRTGQTLTNANGNLISMSTSTFDKLREAANASTSQAKQQKLRRIKQKLKAGQKLSDEELGFLRVNDPKTYKKAKHADEAREELKAELKRAKSKAEAQEIMSRALVKASAEAMAELGALGQGGGATSTGGGGSVSGGEVSASTGGGDVSVDDGGISATAETHDALDTTSAEKISGAEKNFDAEKISGEKNSADKNSVTEKNSSAQKNSDDKFTPEDIMEKYLWTIRALHDEWQRFMNSDAYKNLPDRLDDDVTIKIRTPDKKFLRAIAAYHRAMNYSDR